MNPLALHYPSYFPSYFSINDILATNERVPCKFERAAYGLGYLDPSSGNKDLTAGTKLELPCWLARALYSRRHIVSCQLPKAFKERYREILKADASLVDLHMFSPHFYEFGRHLLPLAGPDAPILGTLLVETLRERLRRTMDTSLNSLDDDAGSHMAKLDELERSLFRAGRKTFHDHQLWLSRRAHIVTTSPMVEQHNKRKFSELT
ncbi:DNA replication complex GINS protein PSF3 [Panulirus ornatus]|uniref:DNA replication complex GINS protein PSF3 n=1 Tax=Panulirus ornatus TaxID=150431 RepID=UPI003A868D94